MADKGPAKETYERGFLNPKEGLASYEWTVQYYHTNFGYANFTLADCNRRINLNFDFSSQSEKEDRIHKIDMLIKQLEDFKKELNY